MQISSNVTHEVPSWQKCSRNSVTKVTSECSLDVLNVIEMSHFRILQTLWKHYF